MRSSVRPAWRVWVVAVVALAIASAACSDDDGPSGVEFGEGEVPSSVPEDFPIPESARIGLTLVDHDRGRTEMNVTFPAGLQPVALYFDQNLVNRGYVVNSSSGDGVKWLIEFERDELEASIRLDAGSDITLAQLVFNTS